MGYMERRPGNNSLKYHSKWSETVHSFVHVFTSQYPKPKIISLNNLSPAHTARDGRRWHILASLTWKIQETAEWNFLYGKMFWFLYLATCWKYLRHFSVFKRLSCFESFLWLLSNQRAQFKALPMKNITKNSCYLPLFHNFLQALGQWYRWTALLRNHTH